MIIRVLLPLTCGILNSRSRLATCTEVTEDAAPTTPDITFRSEREDTLQRYSASSMLLIEPAQEINSSCIELFYICDKSSHASSFVLVQALMC